MADSILDSIKKLLQISPDYTVFDADIVMHINSVFSGLYQIGASPLTPFAISDATATWSDFLADVTQAALVKSYVYLKVRLLFDPPASSYAITAFQSQIAEMEWRLNNMELAFNPTAYDPPVVDTQVV